MPALFFIRKGKWYKYNVIRDSKDRSTPILNLDDLEKFVVDKEYEAIPEVFPNDYGDIPIVPSMLQKLLDFINVEVHNKGGLINVVLMKDEHGDINYQAGAAIYGMLFLTLMTLFIMCRDAVKEIKND